MTALALIHKDKILEQVAQGVMLDEVADSLGIAAPNISKHLSKDPEYALAREIGAELRLHRACSRVNQIADLGVSEDGTIVGLTQKQGNLARVRESALKAAQWFAEREFPKRWGKQEATVTLNNNLNLSTLSRERVSKLLNPQPNQSHSIESSTSVEGGTILIEDEGPPVE